MFNMGSAPSLSDIAAVTKDGNGDGWGNGNGWWVLIILFAIFGGWGNGWGGQGRNGESCATNGDLQRGFDTQSILNKLNGINSGICDGFYAMNTSMLQSTNALQSAISDSANASNIANLQSTNAIQTQLADCCCQNRQGQAQIQYDMATNTCAITNAINNQTRDIIDNDNANYRALHDEMVKMQMDAKDQTIASQQAAINKLELTAAQCAQNQYLVNQLRPAAVPAFTVPNPYANYGFGCYCGSSNNGCC